MEGFPFQSELPVYLLLSCAEIFGRPPMSERAVKAYFHAVGVGDVDRLVNTLHQAIRHGDRFPTPHDLRVAMGIDPVGAAFPLMVDAHV